MDPSDHPQILMPLLTMSNSMDDMDSSQQSPQSGSGSPNSYEDSIAMKYNSYLNRGSELWAHWTWMGGQGKMSLMRCNYCMVNKQLKNAPKCRRHLIKCVKTPEFVRKFFEKKEKEATQVSAFMRQIRSRDVKLSRSEVMPTEMPMPTANDLKHMQKKNQSAVVNSVINKNINKNGSDESMLARSAGAKKSNSSSDLSNKTNVLMNYSPMINRQKNSNQNTPEPSEQGTDNKLLSMLYQQILSMNSPAPSSPENGNVANLKRKLSPSVDIIAQPMIKNMNKENSDWFKDSLNDLSNNTVVINLDDAISTDSYPFFGSVENDQTVTPSNNQYRKKKKTSIFPGYNSEKNGNAFHNGNTQVYNSKELDIIYDDLNDLLASALISAGVDFDFVENAYFHKYIMKLVSISSASKSYNLPSSETLITSNMTNLSQKFEHETAKLFSDSDSIVVVIGSSKDDVSIVNTLSNSNNSKSDLTSENLDVNLLVTSSNNTSSHLFYKTIPTGSCETKENLSLLHDQIHSLINKIGPNRINAVILPYDEGRESSQVIYDYLTQCHNHIVPLTNSYELFHHLLCDICKVPTIYNTLVQCITFIKQLSFDSGDFQQQNQELWKRVFESDTLKIYKHFVTNESPMKNKYWISLNLMLCWFLVGKSSIIELVESLSAQSDGKDALSSVCPDLELSQIEQLFDKISILFNFLTPFINAIHLIENDSRVISDIIKIYYDVKLAIDKNNFYNGIHTLCDKTEQEAIDSILNSYLQESNFSRFFFLAYYLDPRFKDDKRIETNEELMVQVYDALFCYANSLGCINNDQDEDREKLADNLYEFRNGDKLYGMQLLKCPKSPLKYWTHLRQFSSCKKLAYCAHRLLSISTRSMMLATNCDNKLSTSFCSKIALPSEMVDKVLPIKSYLVLHSQKKKTIDLTVGYDEEDLVNAEGDVSPNNSLIKHISSTENISNIISNVISSLNQYSSIFAQPFTQQELASFNADELPNSDSIST